MLITALHLERFKVKSTGAVGRELLHWEENPPESGFERKHQCVGTIVKNPLADAGGARDVGSIPGSRRSPEVGSDNPLQYSCLVNSMARRAWQATVHGVTQSPTGQPAWTYTHTHTHQGVPSGAPALERQAYLPSRISGGYAVTSKQMSH